MRIPIRIIGWMADDIRGSLNYKRENDKEFNEQSNKNKKNKVEGTKGKIGHSQRSI